MHLLFFAEAVQRSNAFGTLPETNKLNSDIGRWFRNQGYCQNDTKLLPNPKKHTATSNTPVGGGSNGSSSEEDN